MELTDEMREAALAHRVEVRGGGPRATQNVERLIAFWYERGVRDASRLMAEGYALTRVAERIRRQLLEED